MSPVICFASSSTASLPVSDRLGKTASIAVFCSFIDYLDLGLKTHDRRSVREGVVRIMPIQKGRDKCPRIDQIRLVAFHHVNAKGPIHARTMIRKVLGNEEFCMQVDAHTEFAKDWDEMVLEEWRKASNEFAVITAVPAPTAEKEKHSIGGSDFKKVPRQCKIKFRDNGFPVSSVVRSFSFSLDHVFTMRCLLALLLLDPAGGLVELLEHLLKSGHR